MSNGGHSHAGDISEVESKKAMQKAKKLAKTSRETTSTIAQRTLEHVTPATATCLPPMDNILRTVQRTRQKTNPQIQTPLNRGDLVLPEVYTKTKDNDLFMCHDSGGDRKRFIIFSTTKNLEWLADCTHWFCDGTFRTVPTIFSQLYTIHGMVDGKVLPFVYVLAPNKTNKIYSKILKVLKDKEPRLNPEVIMTDFEEGFIYAAGRQFPRAVIRGCHFHLGQCHWRAVQRSGLQKRYETDESFALHTRMLTALAFVPSPDVRNAFETLTNSAYFRSNNDDFEVILKYFSETWIGIKHRQSWRNPRFSIDLWNVYISVKNNEPRTNNAVEGWHNGFNSRVAITHASIDKFINTLQNEQHTTELIMEQNLAGRPIAPKKRRMYRDRDARLERVADTYEESDDVLQYLRAVAYNIKY